MPSILFGFSYFWWMSYHKQLTPENFPIGVHHNFRKNRDQEISGWEANLNRPFPNQTVTMRDAYMINGCGTCIKMSSSMRHPLPRLARILTIVFGWLYTKSKRLQITNSKSGNMKVMRSRPLNPKWNQLETWNNVEGWEWERLCRGGNWVGSGRPDPITALPI